eukprot:jgi/Undpi1/9354/HiC_scaffold_26.g11812.m1
MRILFLTNAHNGMSQALYLNLTQKGHQVMLHVARGEDDMLAAHDAFGPDAIVAPFLTKRVPERLWKNNNKCPVLIVHPGVRGDRGVSSIDWALKGCLPEWGVTILQADEEMDAGDVWKSSTFSVPHSSTLTKSALYNKTKRLEPCVSVTPARVARTQLVPRSIGCLVPSLKVALLVAAVNGAQGKRSMFSRGKALNLGTLSVWVSVDNGIAYVHSDFYNGAASTCQCKRLTAAIQEVGRRDSFKVIMLMGGENSYGNGINLNTIEASTNPQMESWLNINAINDSVKAAFSITDKTVISVMRGNAGAGGAMAAMASDIVWAHENVILNPHYKVFTPPGLTFNPTHLRIVGRICRETRFYKAMELTGGEYWTFFLKRRVGKSAAKELTGATRPITASQAHAIGMVNDLLHYSPSSSFSEEGINIGNTRARDRVIKRGKNRRAATVIKNQIKERIDVLVKEQDQSNGGIGCARRVPGLGIVMANGRPDSSIYVDAKLRAAKAAGMKTALVDIPTEGLSPTDLEAKVLAEVRSLNERDDIDGIVVQMPLPTGVDSRKVVHVVGVS